MYNLLCPDMIVDSLYEIDFMKLHNNGIRGLIFDLDNTIIPWDSDNICPKIACLVEELLNKEFKVVIISNNRQQRVQTIASLFNVPYVYRAFKPAKSGFRQALHAVGLSPCHVAVVGDQLYTDVLGGNRLGMYTIWVKPLSSSEFVGTKITRQLEKITVKFLKAKGLL